MLPHPTLVTLGKLLPLFKSPAPSLAATPLLQHPAWTSLPLGNHPGSLTYWNHVCLSHYTRSTLQNSGPRIWYLRECLIMNKWLSKGKIYIRKAEFKVKGTCSFFIHFPRYHLIRILIRDAWSDTKAVWGQELCLPFLPSPHRARHWALGCTQDPAHWIILHTGKYSGPGIRQHLPCHLFPVTLSKSL